MKSVLRPLPCEQHGSDFNSAKNVLPITVWKWYSLTHQCPLAKCKEDLLLGMVLAGLFLGSGCLTKVTDLCLT